jgi:hypothetical protein
VTSSIRMNGEQRVRKQSPARGVPKASVAMTDEVTRPSLWTFSELKRLFIHSYNDFNEDQAPRLGAALAYYTALSLAPL